METETVEFKKSFAELKEGLVSIAAILNKHGAGELWFGVRNDGKAVGLDASEKSLRNLSQSIASHIEPRIYPQVFCEIRDGARCVKVVFSGKDAPYFAFGRAYMRVADEDRQLSSKELENLILAKNRNRLHWDSEAATVGFDDLDDAKLKRFIERAGLTWDTPVNALEKLGLIKEGWLLNASALFFSKTAPMQLRCAVFATTNSATIIDRHDFDGDILELIEEAQKYILKNIHIGMRLKGLYREDVPEISSEALREAIINAFCHRDYRDPDYVQIAIFKNRVEIRSPGGLYDDMTIEKMLHGNVSKRRNPLIANLLRRIQMVEAWGHGMPLILKNAPDVKFREISNIFIASFDRLSFAEAKEISCTTEETTEETTGETTFKELRSADKMLLKMMAANPVITQRELAAQTRLTEDGVYYQIKKLKKKGVLVRTGATKAGRWVVLINIPND
jgi:ATP-dependent DNA helicase RecG